MDEPFNFSGLKEIYAEAWKSDDKTIAFEIQNGKGRFLFMMLLSKEDKEAKDILFIFLKNTNKMIQLKLYGSHINGDFNAYIKGEDRDALIAELGLTHNSGHSFSFVNFLEQLNRDIPVTLLLNHKINTLRKNKELLNRISPMDESQKTVFNGVVLLEKGVKSPRDQTLRKLYLYTGTDSELIAKFIQLLKQRNMTVKWTTPDKKDGSTQIDDYLYEL